MKCPTGARGVVVTFNEGTSEGAKKGWESRGGGGSSSDMDAEIMRIRRESEERRRVAQEAHEVKMTAIKAETDQYKKEAEESRMKRQGIQAKPVPEGSTGHLQRQIAVLKQEITATQERTRKAERELRRGED